MNLQDLVNRALSEAESSLKIASEEDATPAPPQVPDFVKVSEDEDDDEKKEKGVPEAFLNKAKSKAKKDAKGDKEEKDEEEEEDEESKKASVYDSATYAYKLAEALDHASPMISKMAAESTSHVKAPGGMQVMQGEHGNEQTKHPKPKPGSVPLNQASHGGGSDEKSQGYPNGIETNKKDFSNPDWTKNKEAALSALQAKFAQVEALHNAGQEKAAQQAYAEYQQMAKQANVQGAPAKHTAGTEQITRSGPSTQNQGSKDQVESGSDGERSSEARRSEKKERGAPGAKTAGFSFAAMPVKTAADPSSPQAKVDGAKGDKYLLSTEPPNAKHFPGNEEVANVTKRDAKTQYVRKETKPFVSEKAFSKSSDPGIVANLSKGTETAKISSLKAGATRALLQKLAAVEEDEEAGEEKRREAKKVREAIEAKKKSKSKSDDDEEKSDKDKDKKQEKESNLMMGY